MKLLRLSPLSFFCPDSALHAVMRALSTGGAGAGRSHRNSPPPAGTIPAQEPRTRRMPESDELNSLPETYALALRLRSEGLGDEAIGRILDIETESVGPLFELAAALDIPPDGGRE